MLCSWCVGPATDSDSVWLSVGHDENEEEEEDVPVSGDKNKSMHCQEEEGEEEEVCAVAASTRPSSFTRHVHVKQADVYLAVGKLISMVD